MSSKCSTVLAVNAFVVAFAYLSPMPSNAESLAGSPPSVISTEKNCNDDRSNEDPPDINPEAKKLRDIGWKEYSRAIREQDRKLTVEGIQKIEAALKIDPRMPGAYNPLMVYYSMSRKDYQTAIRRLEEGIKHNPKSNIIHFDLGNVYNELKLYAKAIEQFQAALDLCYKYKDSAFNNIGNAYFSLGQMRQAVAYYQKALAENPKHLNARLQLTVTYTKMGNTKAARLEAQRLAELDPSGKYGAIAREALEYLKSR